MKAIAVERIQYELKVKDKRFFLTKENEIEDWTLSYSDGPYVFSCQTRNKDDAINLLFLGIHFSTLKGIKQVKTGYLISFDREVNVLDYLFASKEEAEKVVAQARQIDHLLKGD